MFNFEFDADGLIKAAEQWGAAADQMPFALSRALNDAVKDARKHLVDKTWPDHVTVRNSQFIGWALHIEFSDKYNLEAKIYDQSKGNVHLKLHDEGGVKTAQGRFAIPTKAVTLTPRGERNDQKPANLHNKVVIGRDLSAAGTRQKQEARQDVHPGASGQAAGGRAFLRRLQDGDQRKDQRLFPASRDRGDGDPSITRW
jgi:hypothetical protein